MMVGESNGTFLYYKNTGTATAPAFAQQSGAGNPFGMDVGGNSSPALGDVDGDGDLDLVVGQSTGTVKYFENTGTVTAAAFVERTGTANPFNGIDIGVRSTATLADIDRDGDADLVIGSLDGGFTLVKNGALHVQINVFTENDAPVAHNASFAVGEGGTISADVPLATDVDGTVTSYVLDAGPAKGTLAFDADGSIVYSTDDDFEALGDGQSETVSFTYHAVDNSGASSAVKTVSITVNGADDSPASSGFGIFAGSTGRATSGNDKLTGHTATIRSSAAGATTRSPAGRARTASSSTPGSRRMSTR